METVNIPSSVISFRPEVFVNCNKLKTITVNSNSPVDLNYSPSVFRGVDKSTCILYVPFGSKTAYQASNQWQDFLNILEMPNISPVANVGPDQIVTDGDLVTLDGSASSDPDGDSSLMYFWSAPYEITLSSITAVNPTFIAPTVDTATTFTFGLVVNDGNADSPVDEVMVTVIPANTIQSDSLALVALYNATDGPNWTNNTNWLIGPVSTWYGVYMFEGRVISIQLPGNHLSGSIPAELGNLTNLQSLLLGNNQLSGSIPAELNNLTKLKVLEVLDNNLDFLPDLSNLQNLTQLALFNL